MEITLGNRFSIKKQIGSGSFGEIFQGIDLQTNQHIAIKLEKNRNSSDKNGHQHTHQLLKDEAEIYKILDGMVGVPRAIAYGTQSYYNILVIDLLDKSLEDLLKKCKGRFSLKTVLMLADQMLLCIEGMHRNYLVHRDLKPENFMMGLGPQFYRTQNFIQHKPNNQENTNLNDENLFSPNNSNIHFEFFQNCKKSSSQDIHENFHNHNFFFSQDQPFKQNLSNFRSNSVYVIDFGLSKYYYDAKQGTHIPLVEHPNMTGTARYASVSALHGLEQSRRDDIESLGYIFIYFLKGRLPWQGLPGKNRKEKLNNILNVKAGTSVEDLCDGIPSEFSEYLSRVKKLHFTEEPNYNQYREMFRELFIREGYVYDYKYDWLEESPIDEEKRFRTISSSRYNSPNYHNYSNNYMNNDHDIFNCNIRQSRSNVLNLGNGIFRSRSIFSNDALNKISKNHSQIEIQNYISPYENEHQNSSHHNHQHNQQQNHDEPNHHENQQHPQHHQSLQELIYVPQSQQQNQPHLRPNIFFSQNRKKEQYRYSDIIKVNSSASSHLFSNFNDSNPEIMKNNGKPISQNPPLLRSASPSPIDRYVPYNNNIHQMKIPTPSHSIHKSQIPIQPPKSNIGSPIKSQIAKPINVNHFVLDNQK